MTAMMTKIKMMMMTTTTPMMGPDPRGSKTQIVNLNDSLLFELFMKFYLCTIESRRRGLFLPKLQMCLRK
jgi:hypothetical protein